MKPYHWMCLDSVFQCTFLVNLIISQGFGYFFHLVGCYVAILIFVKQGEGNLGTFHLTHSLWFTYWTLRLPEKHESPESVKLNKLSSCDDKLSSR